MMFIVADIMTMFCRTNRLATEFFTEAEGFVMPLPLDPCYYYFFAANHMSGHFLLYPDSNLIHKNVIDS